MFVQIDYILNEEGIVPTMNHLKSGQWTVWLSIKFNTNLNVKENYIIYFVIITNSG